MAGKAFRYLLLGGAALGILGLIGGAPPEARPPDPLEATRAQVMALRGRDQGAAADLLEHLLAPLQVVAPRAGEPGPPPVDVTADDDPASARIEALERQLAEALAQLPGRERALLWGMVLEPSLDEGRRSRLLRILEGSSRDPVSSLEKILRHGDGAPAWEAAVRLGLRKELGSASALREAAARWRGWGRQYAILGLVLLGDREAVPELRAACYDASPAVRRHAALALGELGTEEDRPFLDLVGRRRPDPVTVRAVLHAKSRLFQRLQGPS